MESTTSSGWRQSAAVFIATVGGAGYSPVAPGTAGTVAAIPMVWLAAKGGLGVYLGVLLAITLIGTWAAGETCKKYRVDDAQVVVIDEVAGYFVTLALVPATWFHLLVGFALFRIFDITKPWPASWADREVHGGFGVMLDDLLAGVYGALILFAMHRSGLSGWVLSRFSLGLGG